jgi:hypothetical protein
VAATQKKSARTAKEKPAQKAPSKPRASRRRTPTHDSIAKRAYELSLVRGDGDHVGHWLEAERELSAS